jgi:DNA-binding IclR family transcriptional regulator
MSSLQLGTLEKAYRILDLYNENAESLTFSEIVEKSGLEKGSVQRLLFTFEKLGLLIRHQRYKRYSLSPRFISYAVSRMMSDPLMLLAIKHLEPLARQTTESVAVAIMDGIHVFYMSRIPNLVSHDFALLPVRRYAYNTAGGRAIMSRLPSDEVEEILRNSPVHRLTPKTVTEKDEIRRLIDVAREDGICWQDGEILENEFGVGAPVLGEGDYPVASVTISVDSARYTLDEAKAHFTDMVRNVAKSMSSPTLSVSRLSPKLPANGPRE